MPRTQYEHQLQRVQDGVLGIGSMVERAIQGAMRALIERDLELSRQVVDEDDAIDDRQLELEELCIDIMATQQPMAGDLRALVTALHVASELERMGDYAEGIAKISLLMGRQPLLEPLIDIPRMSELAIGMLRTSLAALFNRDVPAAEQVRRQDDEVDALYAQVNRELLTLMAEDPRRVERATRLLWVAHNLERIADRATNIAERAIFVSTGRMPPRGESWEQQGPPGAVPS